MGVRGSKTLPSVLSDMCPAVELLDHVVIHCLIFLRNCHLFSTAAAPFYIPTGSAQGSQCVHILTNAYCFLFSFYSFHNNRPNECKVLDLIVGLICIST